MTVIKGIFTIFFVYWFFIHCATEEGIEEMNTADISTDIHHLEKINVYFGHQSIGGNILSGLEEVLDAVNSKLIVVDIDSADKLPQHFFAHGKIGKNEDPVSKIVEFKNIVTDRFAGKLDVAMMKLCYIDINVNTDVKKLFNQYQESVKQLRQTFPRVTIVHVTAPLRATPNDITIKLREFLGRKNRNKLANIKRNEFNDLVRQTYASEPIFDLARIESTYAGGDRSYFKVDGKKYFSLYEKYTYDGGHLNETGARLAAIEMLNVLSNIAADKYQSNQ